MNILILIQDAPYGTEKAYNALRLALQLSKDYPDAQIHVFLIADAVACAVAGQTTPNGYYNIQKMLQLCIQHGASVKICGSCLDARGLRTVPLIEGTQPSHMAELATWVMMADKVLQF